MMDVRETTARTVDEYVAMAGLLGRDAKKRAELSAMIANRKDRIYRDKHCIAALEAFLNRAVRAPDERRQIIWHVGQITGISISSQKLSPSENRSRAFESGSRCRQITFVTPQCWSALGSGRLKEMAMNKLFVAAVIGGSFISWQAQAQERAGSAALGAVSGAVVLGPVGAVAGAFIGYAAGPAIVHSWGVGRSSSRARARSAAQSGTATEQQAAASATPLPAAKPREAVASRQTAPPVQGFE
jgi:Bacteriocin class II with double-glycine leader peptide